jgi:nucleoside-diphosphate-sugar epimerase
MKIAVAGSTGRVGRYIVETLESAGHQVVPMARARGVDIVTGEGLRQALAGVECVIDAASSPSPEQTAATNFFTAAAHNLQRTGALAGVKRMVVVSIIGIDHFTAGYNAAKLAHERAVLSGPIPVSVLRAAQFHEFVAQLVAWGRQDNVSRVPQMPAQLVAARTVAQALASLATAAEFAPATGSTDFPQIAGPRVENMADAAKRLVARDAKPLKIEGVDRTDDPDWELYRSGALLPGPNATLAGPTFDEWLASRPDVVSDTSSRAQSARSNP